ENLFGIIGKAERKKIPDFTFFASNEFSKGLIEGLFAGDAGPSPRAIEYSTKSYPLALQIAMLLTKYNIHTNIYPQRVKGYPDTYWRVVIMAGENVGRFHAVSPSTKPNVENKIQDLINAANKREDFFDTIPISDFAKIYPNSKNNAVYMQFYRNSRVNKSSIMQYARNTADSNLENLVSYNCAYLEVTDLQALSAPAFVYNIQTEDGNYFTGNGILVKNCNSLLIHKADWLKNIGTLIIDEVHELDSDRGATLEMVITKLRILNPKIQIVALSATVPNADELAVWLNAKLIESDYRPVPLKEGVYYDQQIVFKGEGKEIDFPGDDPIHSFISDTVKQKKQVLVFANTRKRAESLAAQSSNTIFTLLSSDEKKELAKISGKIEQALETPTEQCKKLAYLVKNGSAFHHAGLVQKQREVVEDNFRSGLIKVIASTPTLAAGINLPAHRVIITSLSRYDFGGMVRIPIREYKQMCLPYNSKIVTKEFGEVEIGKIVSKKTNCNVLSWNEGKSKLEFKPITQFFQNKTNELIEFKTAQGTFLKLTEEHPVLTKNGDDISWKKTGELQEGNTLAYVKNVQNDRKEVYFLDLLPRNGTVYVKGIGNLIDKAKKKLKITDKGLSKIIGEQKKNIYHLRRNRKAMKLEVALKLCTILNYSKKKKIEIIKNVKTTYGNVITLPKTVDKEFLWLAGFIATDGNLNRSKDKRTGSTYSKIRAFNINPTLIKRVEVIARKLGLNPCINTREDGLITLEAGATLLCDLLKTHFGINYGNKTQTVKIPEFLLNSSKENIGAFLGGAFDGDGNYSESTQKYGSRVLRVLFGGSSKEFAKGIQKLLLRLSIVATLSEDRKHFNTVLKGKNVTFKKPKYYVTFRKIEYIQQFQKYAIVHKTKINVKYSKYHNIQDFHDKRDEELVFTKIVRKKVIKKRNLRVYNIQVKGNENYVADNCLVHNCGRAGRPKYDKSGESIILCKTSMDAEDAMRNYVLGEMENISSKLGVEPILRMHLLSLIAARFVFDLDSMDDFFARTLYAHQYKDMDNIKRMLRALVKELGELEFVEGEGNRFWCTKIGQRVAELYLDPLSAYSMIQKLKKKSVSDMGLIYAMVDTTEFRPYVRVSAKQEAEKWEELQANWEKLPIEDQNVLFSDQEILEKWQTVLFLDEWMNEVNEQQLLEKFGMAPGVIRTKLVNADWLLYGMSELSPLVGMQEKVGRIAKLRKRMRSGIKEELVLLCELRGIGRVRARKLFNVGIKNVGDVKNTSVENLSKVIGTRTAMSVKKQLGEDFEKGLEKKIESNLKKQKTLFD
ncbi:MAG: LAGLIDADG family homing endonuclease, partial [Candidatus Diapherotrites archaeon]